MKQESGSGPQAKAVTSHRTPKGFAIAFALIHDSRLIMSIEPPELHSNSRLHNIKLAIVCPMANEEASAAAFVNAVLQECNNQGFSVINFFAVIDNKSTDQTRSILDDLARRQPEVHLIW